MTGGVFLEQDDWNEGRSCPVARDPVKSEQISGERGRVYCIYPIVDGFGKNFMFYKIRIVLLLVLLWYGSSVSSVR